MPRLDSDLGTDGDPQCWATPIKDRVWVNPNGIHWRMRGPELTDIAVRRLLKRQDLRVLHAYGPQPHEVTGSERFDLLTRVGQFFAGNAPPMSEFRLGDFRNADHQVMLVVEEHC